MNKQAPASTYVRDNYDALLTKLPHGYTDFRWNDTEVSRFHYRQSRRALARGMTLVPERVSRALEIGGGAGAWTPFFASRATQLDFLDISEEMLKEAKVALASFTQITYLHTDFLAWEPEPAAYNLVASIRNIEYMQDKRSVLARMSRALSRGGTLILSTKSPHFDWNGYFDTKALHSGQISITELTTLLAESGFEVVQVYPAIIGKKTRYAPMRLLWDGLQQVLLRLPLSLMPLSILKYISESFLIVARRV